jgi:hypothetical protein
MKDNHRLFPLHDIQQTILKNGKNFFSITINLISRNLIVHLASPTFFISYERQSPFGTSPKNKAPNYVNSGDGFTL